MYALEMFQPEHVAHKRMARNVYKTEKKRGWGKGITSIVFAHEVSLFLKTIPT